MTRHLLLLLAAAFGSCMTFLTAATVPSNSRLLCDAYESALLRRASFRAPKPER
jgi:hypothetical protein